MTTIGVLGGRWRASLTPWGAIEPWDESPTLDWYVAADDRWHTPSGEAAVRQTRVDGTCVVETRVRIPDGDAVQRVWSVPDAGGLTLIEIENSSPLPIAVAFSHGRLLTVRPPSAPIEGIDLPSGSVAFPVGHHATLLVALPHTLAAPGTLPGGLPPIAAVVRGWTATVERASRLLTPEPRWNERVVSERCELALAGPAHPDDDPVGFLLGVAQVVRMGERADALAPDVAHTLEVAAKQAARHGGGEWSLAAAIDGVDTVFASLGDQRARRDLAALRSQLKFDATLPDEEPADGARFLAWIERRLALPEAGGADLLPAGLPIGWRGANFEVYSVPTGGESSVSMAVRWHGSRPAVLWEQTGVPVRLRASEVAPAWSTSDVKGETLWPEPSGAPVPTATATSSAGPSADGSSTDGPSTISPSFNEGGSFS